MLLKLALCTKPKRLMEIGSFRGYTALYLAQNVSADAKIVTVDRSAEHGEAYLHRPEAAKIERRIGETGPAMFAHDAPGTYDLIFIDADHSYQGVRRDTELTLPLVSRNGYLVWHDYANWGYFNGYNGVPEYLKEISATRALAHITGSDLAIYSPAFESVGDGARSKYLRAIADGHLGEIGVDPWQTTSLR